MRGGHALFRAALLAGAISTGSPVRAGDDRFSDPEPDVPRSLRECTVRNDGRISCHVCLRDTFESIPENHPALNDRHAREDYLKFYRHRQACRRNPDSPECKDVPDWRCS
jgi:hypothetical protein